MAFGSTRTKIAAVAALGAASLVLAACGGSSSSSTSSSAAPAESSAAASSASGGGSGEKVAVSLITKDSTNPFFVAMQNGAKAAGEQAGVDITVASGKKEGDSQSQIDAIEAAIAAGQKGILITPMDTSVNDAITKAREAGLYVIALDTPTDPADIVDITFATDNFEAGVLIGKWACAQLGGKDAVIALLDIFNDKVVSVDYNRDNGFLTCMGIDVKDPKKLADEDPEGSYKCETDGKSGKYTIVGNVATGANEEGGRTGMEQLLAKNDKINVVYTINEPTALGADAALKAAGKTAIMVSVDGGKGGCEGVKSGAIGATSQQYPLLMVDLGVKAIKEYAANGTKPTVSAGLDFFNTGVTLITDKPVEGLESKDSQYCIDNAWG